MLFKIAIFECQEVGDIELLKEWTVIHVFVTTVGAWILYSKS